MSEQRIGVDQTQHLNLPRTLNARQFAGRLTGFVMETGFAISRVHFDDLNEPPSLEPKDNLGSGNEGVFVLKHSQKGTYLVQFESAYLHQNGIFLHQVLMRRIEDSLPLTALAQSIHANQDMLHYQHQEGQSSEGNQDQKVPTIEITGSDEVLQQFAVGLQEPVPTVNNTT